MSRPPGTSVVSGRSGCVSNPAAVGHSLKQQKPARRASISVASTSYAADSDRIFTRLRNAGGHTLSQSPCTCLDCEQLVLQPMFSAVQLDERPKLHTDPGSGGGGRKRPDKDPDFYANVGSAIRTLREDIPLLFQKDLDYEIYRPDIVFRDPKNSFKGLKNYQTIFWSLRFHGTLFFKELRCEIKRLWQMEDTVIRMRWTVVGYPRLPAGACGIFDGVSEFRLDSQGKIYEHAVDNVILRDPPMLPSPILMGWNLISGPSTQAVPCPSVSGSLECARRPEA